MTLPSSGAISLQDIQNEFGGSHPISLSEYYGAASGIPSSGQISLSQFYGKSSITTENQYTGFGSNATSYYMWADEFIGMSGYGITWGNTEQVSHDGWQGSSVATYNFFTYVEYSWQTYGARIKSNVPFPAHSGTRSGWRYFGKRHDTRQFSYGDDFGFGDYFPASRTTGSSYPY